MLARLAFYAAVLLTLAAVAAIGVWLAAVGVTGSPFSAAPIVQGDSSQLFEASSHLVAGVLVLAVALPAAIAVVAKLLIADHRYRY